MDCTGALVSSVDRVDLSDILIRACVCGGVHACECEGCQVSARGHQLSSSIIPHPIIFLNIHILPVHSLFVCIHTYARSCLKTACRSQFCSFTMWVLRIKLKSSGLVASILTHWAISPASWPILLRQGLLLNVNFTFWLCWLASKFPGSAYFHSSVLEL